MTATTRTMTTTRTVTTTTMGTTTTMIMMAREASMAGFTDVQSALTSLAESTETRAGGLPLITCHAHSLGLGVTIMVSFIATPIRDEVDGGIVLQSSLAHH